MLGPPRCARGSSPTASGAWLRIILEVVSRTPAGMFDGDDGVSQVPGEPSRSFALFSDPGVTGQALRDQGLACPTRPPRLTKARARRDEISGLNRTAFDLAVYASQGQSPTHHARLASGRWPGSTGRDLDTRRVPTKGFEL